MRIRSNLTDGTIYETVRARRSSSGIRRDGHSGENTPRSSARSPGRRLMRLVILLTLVLILMREAANPDVYRNFFGALGAPLVAEPLPLEITQSQLQQLLASQTEPPNEPGPQSAATPASENAGDTAAANDNGNSSTAIAATTIAQPPSRLDALIAELGKDGRRRLTDWLANVRRYERESAGSDAEVDKNSEATSGQDELIPETELLDVIASAAAGSGQLDSRAVMVQLGSRESLLSPAGKQLRTALQAALDRDYLRRVSDATIWTKNDADAFYRWLEIGSTDELARTEQPVYVGFVSLLDQPAVYRGARVAMRGTAVRAEQLPAASNPFGIKDYWLIWIRPDDGSDRPIMGYAEQIPDALLQLTSTGVNEEGPAVLLDGVFLRRHLYQSQKGSELAPVIVGKVHSLEQRPNAAAVSQPGMAQKPAPADADALSSQLVKLVAIAAVFGLGFTFLVARYTAKTGRWRREIRQRGLAVPVAFPEPANHEAASHKAASHKAASHEPASHKAGPPQPESSTATRSTSESNSHD